MGFPAGSRWEDGLSLLDVLLARLARRAASFGDEPGSPRWLSSHALSLGSSLGLGRLLRASFPRRVAPTALHDAPR